MATSPETQKLGLLTSKLTADGLSKPAEKGTVHEHIVLHVNLFRAVLRRRELLRISTGNCLAAIDNKRLLEVALVNLLQSSHLRQRRWYTIVQRFRLRSGTPVETGDMGWNRTGRPVN
ncbi:hypothetical protein HPP92_028919 [Vanilla planifolia]|uniref:Uncharacterized protein n=1 Tax=Vanilla planifolia TaxID=51239 RepID=A0A835P5U9_VANPL|nr:hypothetical protein HPP92_028909 [Vanilla planifolia]KAG0446272.1 hypothetical protein HPP92_028919 [Vanilla planifolia]